MAIDTPDEDWLDFFAPETDPLDPNGLSTSLREDFLGAVPGDLGDEALDLLAEGWKVPSLELVHSTEHSEGPADQPEPPDARQAQLKPQKHGPPESANGRYTLRSRQEQASSGRPTEEAGPQKQGATGRSVKSLRIRAFPTNGFLIPMQPITANTSSGKSSSESEKGASEAQTPNERTSAGQSTERLTPVGHPGEAAHEGKPEFRGGLAPDGRVSSLASQNSEQLRVVTASALVPQGAAASQRHGAADNGVAKSEGKRRKKVEGLPTSRVTRSAVKKQQGPEDRPKTADPSSEAEPRLDEAPRQKAQEWATASWGSAAMPAEGVLWQSLHQGQACDVSLESILMGTMGEAQQSASDFAAGHRQAMQPFPPSLHPGWKYQGPSTRTRLIDSDGHSGWPQPQGSQLAASRPPRHPQSGLSYRPNYFTAQASRGIVAQEEEEEESLWLKDQSRRAADAAVRAEISRLEAQSRQLHWRMSQQSHRMTAAEESEQKVRLLIGKLDKMRTLHGPGLKQIVDLVQQINDARSPEPDGRNSRYSRLFGKMMADEPGFGLRDGCFDNWAIKKDITSRHSMVQMAFAYGNGHSWAGEMEMEVMCDAFVNHRVKIKELLRMTVEFYISVRTFYMASMATLVAKMQYASTEAERDAHKLTVTTALMESACVDTLFVMSNPTHYQCSDNWVVKEVAPDIGKAEAMARVRNKMLEVNVDVDVMRRLFDIKTIKQLPWRERERELKAEIEGLRAALEPQARSCMPLYSQLINTVGELEWVQMQQRAIDSAGVISSLFAALDPYQMAEVGAAGMPHYPDIEYIFANGLLPR